MMKRSRYAVLFLSLFLSALAMEARPAQGTELEVLLLGLDENGEMVVLFVDGMEIIEESITTTEDCRFVDIAENEQITFEAFVKRFIGQEIKVVFAEREGNYFVIECRGEELLL